MKKFAISLGMLLVAFTAHAAVTVGTTPTSLVTSSTTQAASSQKAVFEFALTGSASETLSSVGVTVNSSTAVSGDLSSISIYQDDGDGVFDAGDVLAGSNSTVNIGSTTTINTASNNTLTGGKYFVVVNTSGTWAGTDSLTLTLNANGITTSANSPTLSSVTSATISAPDLTGPMIVSAVAANKVGGTGALEAGDQVIITFNEATNKPAITQANIASTLMLSSGHVWLDGAGAISSATWNSAGTVLTITLSGGTSLPTLALGDTVTVSGSVIKDAANNNATGSVAITGSFGITPDNDNEDDDDDFGKTCNGGIINGRIYKVNGSTTVYLAASCRLKPFRGAAVFHARGHKFKDIIILSSLNGIQVSDKPALPAGGTLVKGSDKTVWFVTSDGHREGFSSEKAFKRLGFNFNSVKVISDSDLQQLLAGITIDENDLHPEGAVIKCSNSSTVFILKGGLKHAFTNPGSFLDRGHTWDVLATIDCSAFNYPTGSVINQ